MGPRRLAERGVGTVPPDPAHSGDQAFTTDYSGVRGPMEPSLLGRQECPPPARPCCSPTLGATPPLALQHRGAPSQAPGLSPRLGDPKAEITEPASSTGPARGLLNSKRVCLLLAWVAGALWAGSLSAVVCALRCLRYLRVASVAGASPSPTAARGPAGAGQGSPGLAEEGPVREGLCVACQCRVPSWAGIHVASQMSSGRGGRLRSGHRCAERTSSLHSPEAEPVSTGPASVRLHGGAPSPALPGSQGPPPGQAGAGSLSQSVSWDAGPLRRGQVGATPLGPVLWVQALLHQWLPPPPHFPVLPGLRCKGRNPGWQGLRCEGGGWPQAITVGALPRTCFWESAARRPRALPVDGQDHGCAIRSPRTSHQPAQGSDPYGLSTSQKNVAQRCGWDMGPGPSTAGPEMRHEMRHEVAWAEHQGPPRLSHPCALGTGSGETMLVATGLQPSEALDGLLSPCMPPPRPSGQTSQPRSLCQHPGQARPRAGYRAGPAAAVCLQPGNEGFRAKVRRPTERFLAQFSLSRGQLSDLPASLTRRHRAGPGGGLEEGKPAQEGGGSISVPPPPPWELQGGPRGPNPAHSTHPPLHPRPRKPSVSSGVSVRPPQTAPADTWEFPGSPLPHLNPGTSRRAPFCALPHPPLQPRQQAAGLVLPKRPRGAPSPSGGCLLAQASPPRALFLDTPVCTQCPVHTLTRPTRSAPTSSELTRIPAPRCSVSPVPRKGNAQQAPPARWRLQPRPALESGGCKRPGVQTAVRPPGARQSGSHRDGAAELTRERCQVPEASCPVQCWAVEPCEVSAGAWLRLGSSQPAARAARPPEGEAERRRGGPTVRSGAGGGGPGAGPSRAGPGRLGGAGPAGGGGRVVRTTDRLLVSGAQPSAASPAQGTGPGRARGKVTATGWALGAARGVPSRVRDAQVLSKVESWYWAEGAWERGPGGGPASASRSRVRALSSPSEAPSTRGVVKCPPPGGEVETGLLRRARRCPLGAPRLRGPAPLGFLLAPPGLPPRSARVATRAPDPEAGNPGTRAGRGGPGRGEGKTPWSR
ncbi:nascent polypeptide-associated complex subunit alpha, muscle-specific form-like [Mesoplodon densirostris]|uniref:nascent polypeptide-associated complex subunit alpha, muscle-specific form-like n=1 Tax=Mesoplodon densirostris TaxID=48708 RepID=UPI0028DCE79D|nr:nascent polypeptide-associated complex subunit alpha, muscle-specific form-like [Mesoplodon densirostris]